MNFMSLAFLGLGCSALQLWVEPGPDSLLSAQAQVRLELAGRAAAAAAGGTAADDDIEVVLGAGIHRPPLGGLWLTEADSGAAGRFKVIWRGDPANSTVIDGGVAVTGWVPVDTLSPSSFQLWAAPAPSNLLGPGLLATRQLYVAGVRFNRTADAPTSLGLSVLQGAVITATGYQTPSVAPLSWTDPTAVEIVSDHTWVQHRCAIVAVRPLHASTPPPAAAAGNGEGEGASCTWGIQLPGSSPARPSHTSSTSARGGSARPRAAPGAPRAAARAWSTTRLARRPARRPGSATCWTAPWSPTTCHSPAAAPSLATWAARRRRRCAPS